MSQLSNLRRDLRGLQIGPSSCTTWASQCWRQSSPRIWRSLRPPALSQLR